MVEVRHFVIEGRVQGVGFRHFTAKSAQRLGLQGWVRNLANGAVEAMVKGSQSDLDQFALAISQGPTHSRVDSVQLLPEIQKDLTSFQILPDGETVWKDS